MKKILKAALVGLALGASAGVATATVGSEETTARPCCSTCEEGWNYCVASCGYTDECFRQCDSEYNWCFRWCSFSC
jgi:hypothetical protein